MNDRERAGEQVAVMDEIVRVADEEAVDAVIVAGAIVWLSRRSGAAQSGADAG